jgi:biopolymer transport protein ExbD
MYEAYHGPNMTPMVDVVMVILIFFMASASILGPEWFLRSALPVTTPAPAREDPPTLVRIQLGYDGVSRVGVGEETPRALPFDTIEARLRDEVGRVGAERVIVAIDASPNAAYADVVRVHEWCAVLGITRVGLVLGGD